MALIGLRRGDITIHAINEDYFGDRWHRLLFPVDGAPAVHLGPGTSDGVVAVPGGFAEWAPVVPVDPALPIPGDEVLASPDPATNPTDGTPAPTPQVEDRASPLGDAATDIVPLPPYVAVNMPSDPPADPVIAPGDDSPPAGLVPKAEAVIWSGPAMMVFPAEPHDPVGNAAAPDAAGAPDAVTRADLDPVLASMAAGTDHGTAPDSGGGDLAAAFLPPDAGDIANPDHGLDLGFAFTPPPMPPPPDMI